MTKLKFNGVVTEVYTTPEKEKVNSIETGANKTEFATTNEATTATDNTKAMTPLRTKEAILALSPTPDLSGYATTIALDEKVDKVTGMGLSTNDYTDDEKTKLSGIEVGANNYTHPSTHPASIIVQDANNRLVSDAEKSTWNGKVDEIAGKGLSTNDYDNTAKAKVDAIPVNPKYTDTVYTHPSNHPASIITESETKRFVSDAEKSTWNSKAEGDHSHLGLYELADATILKDADIGVTVQAYNVNTVVDASYVHTDNNYTTTEKNKLAGIETGAEVNVNADWNSASGDSQILNKPVLSIVATSGSYTDLSDKPAIPDTSALMPISGGVLENYREKLVTLSGTSTTINLSLGNVFTHTLSGNTTYSITNAVSGVAHSFTLIITQTSTVRTLTFPSSVKWQGGEIPDLSTASKTYVLTFMTVDGGTTWLGMFGGEF